MITRFAVLPDERRVLLGIDKANVFEAGFVYEAYELMDEIIIRKIGKFALPEVGHPGLCSDVNTQVMYGMHLLTKEEKQRRDELQHRKG